MKYINILWVLLMVWPLQAQHMDERLAPTKVPLSEIEVLKMPSLDNDVLMEAELNRRRPGVAPRFAEVFAVDVKPSTHGHWEYLADGRAVWRLRISSPGAYSLNLGFTQYQMPKGGRLILYSPDRKLVQGPFTPADNEDHAQLWTPILEGDELVLEVQLPKEKIPQLGLHLSTVNHDFMGFARVASGNCNLDVLCGAADGYDFVEAYREEIQSVAVYGVRGSLFCTGFLVNNTRQDCRPFFMTAAHCEVTAEEAASLVVYWNYENSTCREVGSSENGRPGDGRLNDFNTGAILRASFTRSDFALLELDDPVSSTAEAYFAGWSRAPAPPQSGVACIHHPNADEKSISYAARATYLGTWNDGPDEVPNGDHVVVPEWSVGTTETGSSGGPLFNEQGLVVGQLHGGVADCAGGGYDTFGWFAVSWEGGGAPSNSLKSWLDPDNTGVLSFPGRSQLSCSFFVEAAVSSVAVCAPDEAVYTLEVSDVFAGPVALQVSGLPEGLEATLNEATVAPGGTTELRITGTDRVNSDTYNFTVIGTDGAESAAAQLELNVFRNAPSPVNLLEPADGAADISIRAGFSWADQPFTTRYEYELATDADFNNIVASVSDLGATQLTNFDLAALTTYYWRVRGRNLCGWGDWSAIRSFTTAGVGCAVVQSVDVPLDIASSVNTVFSALNLTAPGNIQELRLVGLDISHTYVGDLRVSLVSPQGTEVILFDRPGLPRTFFGCDGDDLRLDFSDDARNTATDLENTCDNQPALEGVFQPREAFANFKGEPVAGVWILKVEDLVVEDAGRLNGWGLEFCTSIPPEEQLYAITDQFQICAGESLSFSLLLGTAFPAPVTIDATGLPGEVAISYSKNPASPGETVDVFVEGLNAGGLYEAVFKADTATIRVLFDVIAPPAPAVSLGPADGAVVDRERVSLMWEPSPGADFYVLNVYEEVAGGAPFLSTSLTGASYVLENLDFGTPYYWEVVPYNACGAPASTELQSFFTRPDIVLSANPGNIQLCRMETGVVEIAVGGGYANPARIHYRIEPTDTLEINFDVDPEAVTPSSSVRAELADLSRLEAGVYQLTFVVQDLVFADSVSVALEVLSAPALPQLLTPENNAAVADPLPTFTWSETPEAEKYRLEIATDAGFSQIVRSLESSVPTVRLAESLDPGAYYWRITSSNRCGGATTAAFGFSLQTTGITEWESGRTRWYPNPTSGLGYLSFERPLNEELRYELYSGAGIRLLVGEIARGTDQAEIDLSSLPAGIYLLRLRRAAETAVLKVIKQ